MTRALRILGLAVSFCGAVIVFAFVAYGTRDRLPSPPLRPIPRAAALALFDGERALAAQLGMTLAEEGESPVTLVDTVGVWRRPINLGARECVAVIVALYGFQSPRALAIQDVSADSSRITQYPVRPLSLHAGQEGVVAQTQWCNWEAHPRVAVAETRPLDVANDPAYREATLHYAVYRGPWERVGGPLALTRGDLSEDGLAALGPDPAVLAGAAQVPAGARSLGAPIDLGVVGARLVPANATTYRRLYDAVRGDLDVGVNPRVDAQVPPGDRWGLGLPVDFREVSAAVLRGAPQPPLHDPVVEVGVNRFRRVLAVVDRGRLGASCAALLFTRLVVGAEANVMRHDADGTSVPLPAEGNVARDAVCPASGVMVYTVDDGDQVPYRLNAYATPG